MIKAEYYLILFKNPYKNFRSYIMSFFGFLYIYNIHLVSIFFKIFQLKKHFFLIKFNFDVSFS